MLCGIWVFIYIYLYLYLYLFIFSRESIVLCCFVIYNTLIPEHTSARAESRSFQLNMLDLQCILASLVNDSGS